MGGEERCIFQRKRRLANTSNTPWGLVASELDSEIFQSGFRMGLTRTWGLQDLVMWGLGPWLTHIVHARDLASQIAGCTYVYVGLYLGVCRRLVPTPVPHAHARIGMWVIRFNS